MNSGFLYPDDPLWSSLLAQLPHDIYHLPTYLQLEATRTASRAYAFYAQQDDCLVFLPYLLRSCADIAPGYANVYELIPAYGYAGLLLSPSAVVTAGFADAALDALCEGLRIQNVCTAFLRLHPILSGHAAAAFVRYPFSPCGETVSMDLSQSEALILADTHRDHRKVLRRGERNQISTSLIPYAEHIDEFIALYHQSMQRVAASPMYFFTERYFQDLLHLGDRVHLARTTVGGQTAQLMICFECDGIFQGHLTGVDPQYLSYSPATTTIHYLRLFAKARGCRWMGIGSGIGGKYDRLFEYKSGFSSIRHVWYKHSLVVNAAQYQQLTAAVAQKKQCTVLDLQSSAYFPVYRTPD